MNLDEWEERMEAKTKAALTDAQRKAKRERDAKWSRNKRAEAKEAKTKIAVAKSETGFVYDHGPVIDANGKAVDCALHKEPKEPKKNLGAMGALLAHEEGIDAAKRAAAIPTLNARLPMNYEAAKSALAQCARLDECKSWGDKAAALASYARQTKDATLFDDANRIRARAVRRVGELLAEFDARGDHMKKGGDARLIKPRTQAAAEAGLSPDQRKDAMAVASIPAAEFEALVDGPNPPSAPALADIGRGKPAKPKADGADPMAAAIEALEANCKRITVLSRQYSAADLFNGCKAAGRGHMPAVRAALAYLEQLWEKMEAA